MKKTIFFCFTLLLGIFLFIFTLRHVGLINIGKAFFYLEGWEFLIIFVVMFIGQALSLVRWQIIFRGLDFSQLSYWLLIKAKTIGASLNYITPIVYTGGQPFKIHFLQAIGNVPWPKGIAAVVLDEAFELSASLVIVLAGAIYLLAAVTLPPVLFWFIVVFFCLCIGLAIFFFTRMVRQKGFFTSLMKRLGLSRLKNQKVQEAEEYLGQTEIEVSAFLRQKRGALFASILLSFIERLMTFGGCWLIVYYLGQKISFLELLALIALTAAIYFLPVPGALGTHEASQALIFNLFGLGAHTGIAFSLILRGFNLIGVIIGLYFFAQFQFYLLSQKLKDIWQRRKEVIGL